MNKSNFKLQLQTWTELLMFSTHNCHSNNSKPTNVKLLRTLRTPQKLCGAIDKTGPFFTSACTQMQKWSKQYTQKIIAAVKRGLGLVLPRDCLLHLQGSWVCAGFNEISAQIEYTGCRLFLLIIFLFLQKKKKPLNVCFQHDFEPTVRKYCSPR